ncbi:MULTISPECIES: tail fiber assembly protein [unclassified Pseudomonas]|uniref:tail fiber assembly protein n=1 Tax=unclassified Pseudomonas TaxID=196821 RepID=UPI00235EBE49|nr:MULTISPECIES: tail fiber assembly protein [unclassified Pseudomonas]
MSDDNQQASQELIGPEYPSNEGPWWSGLSAPLAYNLDPATGEYLGSCKADPSPLEPDVWLYPAHSVPSIPPIAGQGQAVVREGDTWNIIADHRGATVYHTATGEPRTWLLLGALPADYTVTAPESAYDQWENGQWHVDEAAKLAALKETATRQRALLLQYASNQISALQDAVDLEIATEAETKALKAWKTYRVLLNRVDTVNAVPAEADWPNSPDPATTASYLAAQGDSAA